MMSKPANLSVEIVTDKNSEFDQEIPQSQTADKPMAPRNLPQAKFLYDR